MYCQKKYLRKACNQQIKHHQNYPKFLKIFWEDLRTPRLITDSSSHTNLNWTLYSTSHPSLLLTLARKKKKQLTISYSTAPCGTVAYVLSRRAKWENIAWLLFRRYFKYMCLNGPPEYLTWEVIWLKASLYHRLLAIKLRADRACSDTHCFVLP